eukprot:gene18545-25052_t
MDLLASIVKPPKAAGTKLEFDQTGVSPTNIFWPIKMRGQGGWWHLPTSCALSRSVAGGTILNRKFRKVMKVTDLAWKAEDLDLDDVLVRDVGDKIKGDGRWPLVIDTSGQTSVFLRYMDTNYVNALSRSDMEPNRLRRSILGGLRYGKPVVLDLMDIDSLWSELPRLFDAVQAGFLDSLMDKSLLSAAKYKQLIRKEDGEEYEENQFQEARMAAFKFVILTSAKVPNEDLLKRTYALQNMNVPKLNTANLPALSLIVSMSSCKGGVM